MVSDLINTEKVRCPNCTCIENDKIAEGHDFEYDTCTNRFSLLKCKNCDGVYLNPRPALSELSIIYPDNYNAYHFHEISNPFVRYFRNYVQQRKYLRIKKLVKKENPRIIDVGCGSGSLLKIIKEYAPSSWGLYANDIDEKLVFPLKDCGIKIITGRFESLEIEHKFDLIILNQVIEHLDNPNGVLQKCHQILDEDGILFIETPNVGGLDYTIFKKKYWGGYHIPRHWQLFSDENIELYLNNFGFSLQDLVFLCSPSFWNQSFHHMLLDNRFPKWFVKTFNYQNALYKGGEING